MNKIFKVVWSKTKHCYVVTSELAKTHTKSNQTKSEVDGQGKGGFLGTGVSSAEMALRASLCAAVLTGAAIGVAQAAEKQLQVSYTGDARDIVSQGGNADQSYANVWLGGTDNTANYIAPYTNGNNYNYGWAYSGYITVYGAGNYVGGGTDFASKTITLDDNSVGNVVGVTTLGNRVKFSYNPYGLGVRSGGQGTGVGNNVYVTSQATALGNDVYALGRSSIAIGSDDNAAYYSESDQITSYDRANYFNTLYTNIDPSGSKYGYDSTGKLVKSSVTKYSPTLAQGDGSIAIGSRSLAYASGATALGTLAFALKPGSTAIGTKTRAEGESALAFGNNTYVFANYTIGVGSKTQVLNSGGTAYGYKTYSGSKGDIAIGTNVYSGVSMETGLTTAQPNSNLGSLPVISAFGLYNIEPVKGARSILGVDNGVTTNISMSAAGLTSVPTSAQQYFDVNQSYIKNLDNIISSEYSGSGAYTGLASIAANTQTLNGVTGIVQTSNGENTVVIGSNSVGSGTNDIVIGRGAIALKDNGFAIGSYSMSTNTNALAIGLASRSTGQNAVALGVASAAMGQSSLALGTGAINYGKTSSVIGYSSGAGPAVENGLVVGSNSMMSAGSTNSILLGSGSSIGNYVVSTTGSGKVYKYNPATGTSTEVDSLSVMDSNTDGISDAMAIGNNAHVYIRDTSKGESGTSAMAIGSGAQAWLDNSLALGVNSKTDYTKAQIEEPAWVTPGAVAASTTAATGVISVGSSGNERRIVNLAAGSYDTDAVNVSQLKQMWDTIQRQMNNPDSDKSTHFVATNYTPIPTTTTPSPTDYVTLNKKASAYQQYVKTYAEFKGYLVRATYGGAQLTTTGKTSYINELNSLETTLKGYGMTQSQINALYVNQFGATATRDSSGKITDVSIPSTNLTGTYSTAADATTALTNNENTDLNVLTQDQNAITGMTTNALTAALKNINYDNSQALGKGSVAVGYGTRATTGATGGVAIGYQATAGDRVNDTNDATNATAVGANSLAQTTDTTAYGGSAQATKIESVAVGTAAKATGSYSTALGANTQSTGLSATAVGESATASATESSAFGQNAAATGGGSLAVGVGTKARATNDVVIGNYSETPASDVNNTGSSGDNSVVGAMAKVYGVNSNGNTVIGRSATAGKDATQTAAAVSVSSSVVVGREASAMATGGTALGYKAAVSVANSVALGNNSTTTESTNTGLYYGTAPNTTGVAAPTWGVVSVGSGTNTRRITNVAAGLAATDAVNVSQLNSLAGMKVTVQGDSGTDFAATLGNSADSTYTGPKFKLAGNTDITTTASSSGVSFALNKATQVTSGDTKAVTADAVYKYVNSSVSGAANLAYKASGESGTNSVALSSGLNFTPDGTSTGTSAASNVLLSTAANGVVNIGLAKDLTGISSIKSSGGAKMALGSDTITFSSGDGTGKVTLTGLADGKNASDAVTVHQFTGAMPTVVAGNYATVTSQPVTADGLSHTQYTVGLNKDVIATDLSSTFAKVDASNITTDTNKAAWRTALNVYTTTQTDAAITAARTTVDTAANSGLTVTKGSAADHNAYTIALDQTNLQANTKLAYKADGANAQSTSLATGLNFTSGTNTTATVDASGVVKYDVKSALTGINSISGGTSGATVTLGSTANTVDMGGAAVKNIANATADSDAVAYGQVKDVISTVNSNTIGNQALADKITGIADSGITLGGNSSGTTTKQKFSSDVNLLIQGDSAGDITTAVNSAGNGLNITLSKDSTVTSTGTKAVTGAAVYSAVTGAKTKVVADSADTSGILTITKTESTDLNPNSYKLGIDTTKLKTAVSADFAAKDASNLTDANVTSWKTKLGVVDAYSKTETYNQNQVNNLISGVKDGYTTVTLDSTNNAGLTLTDTSTTTGQHAYKLGLNGTTIAQNTSLSYKASGDADAKSVTLENGLTFNGDSNGNIVASTGANGNVTYSLSSTLSGISSISNGGKTIAFTAQGVDFAGLPLNNIGTSTNASSAATVGQLNAVKTGADATQTDLNALKDNTIRLYGDDKSTSTVTNAKKLSASPLSFDITGNDDITTAATTTGVSLALNKITDLTSLNSNNISSLGSRVATSGAVYNAIVGAKTKVEAGGLLTLTKTESTDLNPNTYTVSIDAETIKRALNVNGDGELQGSIDYKANGGAVSSVGLTPGFNFTDGTNTKATVAAEGVVTFDLKDALTGIKSIANNPTGTGSQITLSSATNEISMNGGKVTNVAAGTDSTDAVNKSQLDAVAAKIGTATNGSNGTNGPAGQDGLDGKNGQPPQSLTDKVNALRNGTAGNMVYTAKATDGSQERLVMEDGKFYRAANIDTNTYAKAIDGKWYKQTDLNMTTGVPNDGATAVDFANVFKSGTTADGSQVATTDVNISAVNANGSVNSSTPLLNITSALGLLPTTTDTLNSKALGGSAITAAAASSVVGAPANGSTPATGIYAAKGAALNQAVTLADLQAVAQAGLNFTGNSLTGTTATVLHAPVNSTVAIQGKDTYDSTTYDAGDNISTKVDTTKNQILITMKKSPSFTSVVVGDTGKQVTVGTDTNGNLHVSDNETPSSGVVINGVKDGTTADSVVTKGALDAVKSQLGLDGTNGTDGTNGGVGPAGKDGLNGHSIVEKVQNQRDGLSGNMVYTDTAGNRLVKGADGYYPVSTLTNANLKQANNGMWYPAANVNPDGSLATGVDASTGKTTSAALTDLGATKIPDNQVQISTVNADGNTTDPTVLRNVGSTLTLNYVGTSTTPSTATVASATKLVNGDSTATNANDKAGLLGLTGTVLNNAATLGEVQAVAQAGLNFGGDTTTLDSTKVVHRALGSEIDIVGGGYTASTLSSYASDNVATLVDTTNNKIRIMMKTAPTFKGITLDKGNGNAVSLAPVVNGSGSGVKLSDASGKPVAITGVASSTDPTSAVTLQQLKDATAAIGGNGVDGATGPAGKDGLNGQSMGTQLVSLRSGTAGNTVYTTDNSATDKSQVRLLTDGTNFVRADSVKNYTQASDGKWYANADVVNGVARAGATPATMSQVLAGLPTVEASKINISNVNADGTVTNPTKLMNVASALTNVSDLKTASGAALNQAATVGDLQKLQAAGTTFAGNTGSTTVGIGETLNVKGGASSYTASDFSGDNLYTVVSGNNLNVVMKKAPSFTSVTVGDSGKQVTIGTDTDGNLHVTDKENPTGGVVITGVKDGTTADSVVTKGALDELRNSITNGKDGANGTNGTPGAGVAGINGTNGHDGVAGADGSVGPSGKDGLAGHNIFDKIESQREGLSGNMVYTDPSGARLVKVDGAYYPASTFDGLKQGTDGKYYPAAGVSADGTVDPAYADQGKSLADVIADKNATAVPSSSVIISTVNPTGETTTPTVIGNVKSTIGLDGTTTNQDGSVTTNGPIAAAAATTATQGLLEKSGAALNNAATVGDLQAVAQAGMTYQTNDKTGSTPQSVAQTVHTPLGSTLSIIGGENNVYKPTSSDKYTPGGYTADNLVTTVTSDGKIQVAMSDAPVFKAATVGDATLTFYKDPNQRLGYVSVTYRDNGVAGTGVDGVVVQGLRTSSDPTSAATKGYVDNKINGAAVVTAPTVVNSPSSGDYFDQAGLGVQVLALRNGVSGPVVYTDANGVRGMRATQATVAADGTVQRVGYVNVKLSSLDGYKLAVDSSGNPVGWFKASADIWKQEIVSNGAGGQVVTNTNQLKDGLTYDQLNPNIKTFSDTDKLQGKIVLSLVSPNGQTEGSSTDNNQVVLHNVDSGLSMLNSTATDSKGVVTDLVNTTEDANLHYAANLTDLKTLATAGLDFNGNAGADIHKNLGEKLSITGTSADTSAATHVETIVPAGNPAGLPANNQFSAENVMTWSDANGLRIGISSNPVFNNVTFGGNTNNPITIINNGSGDLQIKDKDGNTRTIITGTVNGFYIADKNNNKSLVKLGDTINFGDYLQVVPGTNTDSSTSNGGTSNSGTSGSGSTDSGTSGSGSTTTSGDGGTVNVTGLVSKTDFDNAITNINNKISNIDISSLKPTGTIGKGQDTDKQAVSGETVKDYLDQNYTNTAQLNERFTKLSKQANAGTASALAAAGIPQVTNMYDDNLMIGAGMGSYGGETAVAIGISGTNDNRDTTYRISTTYDSTGKWGLSGGVGFSIGSGSNTPKPQAAKALAERVDRLEAENKALRQSNETEIKDLAAKNDQLQAQVQQLQAMIQQLMPQAKLGAQAAAPAAQTPDKAADETQNKEEAKTAPTSSAAR